MKQYNDSFHYFGIPPRVFFWMLTGFWAGVAIAFLIVRIMERAFEMILSNDTAGLIVICISGAAGLIGLIAGGIRQIQYERIGKDSTLYYDTDKKKRFLKEAIAIILINLISTLIFMICKNGSPEG